MPRQTASRRSSFRSKPRPHRSTLTARSSWNREKYSAFAAELDALHEDIQSKLGPRDVTYIKKVERVARLSEIAGRLLIHVSLDPFTWSAGVFALFIHNQLHTAEIGHSALHGCWDGLAGAELFYSASFKWKTPVDEASWRREHNILHHQYTNIVGRDPDLSYGILRASPHISWIPYHLLQVAQLFWTAPAFLWIIATYATGLTDLFHSGDNASYAKILPDRKPKTLARALQTTLKKNDPLLGLQLCVLAGLGRSDVVEGLRGQSDCGYDAEHLFNSDHLWRAFRR